MRMRDFIITVIAVGTSLSGGTSARAADGGAPAPATAPATRPVDEKGMKLIYAIAQHKKPEALELIKQGADVNARDGHGNTHLYYACTLGRDLDIAKVLVEHGAEVNAHCIGGFTPLHHTMLVADPDVVAYLISKGADVNAREAFYGDTPLHVVASDSVIIEYGVSSPKKVAELLLSHGADVNAIDKDGRSPLDFANEVDVNSAVAKLLISKGGKSGKALAHSATQKSP
jgi:ankyrin repeat protein